MVSLTLRGLAALALLGALAACDTPAQGAAAGAVVGGVAANVTDNDPVIGAVGGAIVGAAISDANCRNQGLCP